MKLILLTLTLICLSCNQNILNKPIKVSAYEIEPPYKEWLKNGKITKDEYNFLMNGLRDLRDLRELMDKYDSF